MSGPSSRPVLAGAVHAVVHADGVATPYLRAGRGAPVVLVAGPEWLRRLMPRLAGGRRVLAPEAPAPRPAATDPSGRLAFCRWLRAFCDGLGVERAALVAGGEHAAGALAFALLEEDRVERLVLLDADHLGVAAGVELAGGLACPCLRLGAGAAAAAAAVRFLAGSD